MSLEKSEPNTCHHRIPLQNKPPHVPCNIRCCWRSAGFGSDIAGSLPPRTIHSSGNRSLRCVDTYPPRQSHPARSPQIRDGSGRLYRSPHDPCRRSRAGLGTDFRRPIRKVRRNWRQLIGPSELSTATPGRRSCARNHDRRSRAPMERPRLRMLRPKKPSHAPPIRKIVLLWRSCKASTKIASPRRKHRPLER